ncbi:hypothetical protein FNV43_RR17909 [Rhamnella rubrinervis]|uniref:MYB transcription factor n=1 Tax=Rhamnella rubrinervis TaxID=2594499 RepID=A0A8K0GVR9_9ROSA|nr:hypothetical protein FNV43_RR17909 [Rhamnella rubrinervis]
MGNPKQKWTSEEEEALRAGVAKHGTGKWKDIQRDPEFNPFLFTRSNIDLKDKWRNMSVASGQGGPREKSRTPKPKAANPDALAPAAQLATAQPLTAAAPVARDAAAIPTVDDSSKGDAKNTLMSNAMIFEAFSTLKEQNGLDTNTIANFIEQRHEVPQNFRRILSTRLRRLVQQDKLEKVQNCFKIKSDASSGTKTFTDSQLGKLQNAGYVKYNDPVEEAAVAAAFKVADAENRSFVAAEAIKEAERISKLAEDTDSMLQFAKEIFEKCSQGEVVPIA